MNFLNIFGSKEKFQLELAPNFTIITETLHQNNFRTDWNYKCYISFKIVFHQNSKFRHRFYWKSNVKNSGAEVKLQIFHPLFKQKTFEKITIEPNIHRLFEVTSRWNFRIWHQKFQILSTFPSKKILNRPKTIRISIDFLNKLPALKS